MIDDIDPKAFDESNEQEEGGQSKLMQSAQTNRMIGSLMERMEQGDSRVLRIEGKQSNMEEAAKISKLNK